jgi:uncharacterized membrane protein
MSQESKIIWSRRGIMLAALVGLFASSYLLYTYTTGSDLKCGALLQGCDTVRISKWASFYGIPTPFFGVVFYLSVLAIVILRAYAPEYKTWLTRGAMILFAMAGFLESLFLTYIQRFVIQQFCSWCLVSAVAATLIFVFVFFDRAYAITKSQSIKELKIIGMSLAVFVVIGGIAFAWLIRPVPAPVISPIFLQGQIQTLEPVSSDSIYNSAETTSTIKIDDVFPKP